MKTNARILFASTLVGACLGIGSVVLDGCSAARLTPDEASAQLDVACSALVRTLVEHDDVKAAAVASAVCRSNETRALIRKAAEHFDESDAGTLFTEHFSEGTASTDGGAHGP